VAWRLVCMCLLLFCGSVFAFASIKCIGALFYIEPSSLLCETGGWLDVSSWVMSQYLDLSLLWRGRAWRIKEEGEKGLYHIYWWFIMWKPWWAF
jgi:hypothetical protein